MIYIYIPLRSKPLLFIANMSFLHESLMLRPKPHRSVVLTMSNSPVLLISASRSTEGESATSPGVGPFIAP